MQGFSEEERQPYDDHGYVVVRKLFDPSELEVEPAPGMLSLRA